MLPRLDRDRWRSLAEVGLVWIGKRVSGPPTDRSRRWPPARGLGAGLVARLRLPEAFSSRALFRSSMLARRLLSSVLIARGRPATTPPMDPEWAVDMRLSSEKMGSLYLNKSRTRR